MGGGRKNKAKRKRKNAQQNASPMDVVDEDTSTRTKRNTMQAPRDKSASENKDELQFEDPFEDEIEEDHPANITHDDTMGDAELQDSDAKASEPARVWRAGVDAMEDGEQLEHDSSAYTAFHRLNVEWPCLSFDLIADNLGNFRTKFPQTAYFVAGTQASTSTQNHVQVVKVADMHRTMYDDDSDNEDDDDPNDLDDDPIVNQQKFSHPGGVNRIRVSTFRCRFFVVLFCFVLEKSAFDKD
jgi:ribosome assembly protein RRB1